VVKSVCCLGIRPSPINAPHKKMKICEEIRKLRLAETVIIFRPMSLDPSIKQASLQPLACLQALIVVAPDGRIQFATAQARVWLENFLHSPLDRLPDAVTRWLGDGFSCGLPSRFIIDQLGTRLCIQPICREANSVGLLLELNPVVATGDHARRSLTERQVEVLSWVARGKTNAEIAEILSLKTGTIGKYLERIFPKLGVENRTAAASFVLRTNGAT
jgi:DNA-binding CsgD family transcriptional regulator